MKSVLPLLILMVGFSTASWAETEANIPVTPSDMAEQQADVETDIESAASPNSDEDLPGVLRALIAILAIVLVFGTPVMLVAAFLYASHRKRRLAREMASEFLASGQQVPPEVWRGLAGDASPRSSLHKGLILVGAGLGIFLCFWLIGSIEAAYLGLIPLFIGIAQLLIWRLERNTAHRGD